MRWNDKSHSDYNVDMNIPNHGSFVESCGQDETVEEYKARLAQVEKIIMPFLTNLLKTADKPYINWPNRKPILEAQIQKILALTRG